LLYICVLPFKFALSWHFSVFPFIFAFFLLNLHCHGILAFFKNAKIPRQCKFKRKNANIKEKTLKSHDNANLKGKKRKYKRKNAKIPFIFAFFLLNLHCRGILAFYLLNLHFTS
jgi:hypothetical protein